MSWLRARATSHSPYGVAPAQSMYQVKENYSVDYANCSDLPWDATPCGCCPAMRGSTAAADFPGVLHVGCGSCLVFTAGSGDKAGAKIGAVVVDSCPYFQNKHWCPANGTANPKGYKNHLDVLYLGEERDTEPWDDHEQAIINLIDDMPTGQIQLIECPKAVVDAINDVGTGTALCDGPCPGFDLFGCAKSTATDCMSN